MKAEFGSAIVAEKRRMRRYTGALFLETVSEGYYRNSMAFSVGKEQSDGWQWKINIPKFKLSTSNVLCLAFLFDIWKEKLTIDIN